MHLFKWLVPKKKAVEGLVMRISTADQVDYARRSQTQVTVISGMPWCNFQHLTIVSISPMAIKGQRALSLLSTRMTSIA